MKKEKADGPEGVRRARRIRDPKWNKRLNQRALFGGVIGKSRGATRGMKLSNEPDDVGEYGLTAYARTKKPPTPHPGKISGGSK